MVSIPILTTIALGFVAVSLGISLVCIWKIKKEVLGLEEEGLAG
jgi:hypothetical protein